ncbi:MAG: outer membrane protein transport protein [Hyphomicrobiaceae bacterium]
MSNSNKALAVGGVALLLSSVLMGSSAMATEGYFQNGIGARGKALAGAGVADGRDATSAALNPAGILRAGDEIDFAVSMFSPRRQFEGSGQPGFTPMGKVESNLNLFEIPNMAISKRLPANSFVDAVALSFSGNGGMNTTYPNVSGAGRCPGGPFSSGVFCGGKAGVDLNQLLVSLAFAKQIGNIAIGVAPVLGIQRFQAEGLAAFGAFGASSAPGSLTNNNHDLSFGGGLRAGLEWAVTPSLRLGVAGSTKIYMQDFEDYKGLFAEGGGFDIPANIQAGVAFDVTPSITAMLDYKHIWYSDVASISNPSTNLQLPDGSGLLGLKNGAGFGWKDVDVIKVGVEWRTTPALTLRAGYSYNTQPVQSRDVMFNILAPGVVQNHITAGFGYKMTSKLELEFAGMYAPRTHVVGGELAGFGNPNHKIDLSMEQFEATIGVKYKFD